LKAVDDSLLGFVKEFSDQATITVEEELGHGYVRLKVTEAERRQALQDIRCVEDVVKEIVRNSRDAGAGAIYVSFQKEKGRWRNITVLDDGAGIPQELHRKIFEARVTSKVRDVVEDRFGIHGRGMALYSIKQVADDVRLVNSAEGRGTIIQARIDTEKVPEKKNQSLFPELEVDENGVLSPASGPNNVPRVLTEFILNDNSTSLFLGSNAEILATLYSHSMELRKQWATGKGNARKPLWFDLAQFKEGRKLHQFSLEQLGLHVSERNAFRIIEREVQPLISVNELMKDRHFSRPVKRADLHRQPKTGWSDNLARRMDQDDMAAICSQLQEIVKTIAEKYHIEVEEPSIKRRKNSLIISIGLHDYDE
jgi:anti-sigma regulatory factor (Ser/Thr protein kinase)